MRLQHLQQRVCSIESVQWRPNRILGLCGEQWNTFFLRQVNDEELHQAQLVSSRYIFMAGNNSVSDMLDGLHVLIVPTES